MTDPRSLDKPAVTVVITTLGRPAWVMEAVVSVLSQEADGRPPRIVVINMAGGDATDDRLRPLVDAGLVRLIGAACDPAAGPAAARNAALAGVETAAVVFLDDDDLLPPGRLSRHAAALAAAPDAVGVVGSIERFTDDAERRFPAESPSGGAATLAREAFFTTCPILSPGAATVRTAAARAAGGFPAVGGGGDDWAFWLELTRAGPLHAVPETALLHRHHGGNLSHKALLALESGLRVLKEHAADAPASTRGPAAVNLMRWVGRPVFRELMERLAAGDAEGAAAPLDALTRLRAFGGDEPELLRLAGATLGKPRPADRWAGDPPAAEAPR